MGGESTINKTIKTATITIERKTITLERGVNQQGEYLRIQENVMDRKNTIVMPVAGIGLLRDALDSLDQVAGE